MNCTFHYSSLISFICIDPHQCQCSRKLCPECQFEHEVDKKHAVPINRFQEIVMKKLKESSLDQASDIATQRTNFKSMLSSTYKLLKNFWDKLEDSINQIYNHIEMEDKSYQQILKNVNPTELPNSDLEKLVQIIIGKQLDDWNNTKTSYLKLLEMTKNCWEIETRSFGEKLNKQMYEIIQLIQKVNVSQESFQTYRRKEDIYQVLAQTKNSDKQFLKEILEMLKKDKITDCLEYLYNKRYQEQPKFKFITGVIKNIFEIDFNKKNYSQLENEQIRKDLIKNISQDEQIIEFLKFLVHLTAIDERFIQCGSNSLYILVEMKVDVKELSFENIRIRDTCLIGGNFVKCIFNGSNFDNVDISGVNLNGAQLFNCKWRNIKIQDLNKLDGNTSDVLSVRFSPDGTILASGSYDNSIRLWDVKTGQLKAKLDGHTNSVYSVCFSPDGTILASGSNDKSIRLWDVKIGQQRVKLDGHASNVWSVCFSPDGTILASGSNDKSIRLWDVKIGQQKAKLDGHSDSVNSVFFSLDGITLASGSTDKSIRLWDIKTGQQKAKLDGHRDSVYSICFSPNCLIIASASQQEIRLWDVKTGQLKAKLDGHTHCINAVSFSPDGTTLASGSDDKSIRLWDIKTEQQKAKLDGHTHFVYSVCFSPDGTSLVSGSYDKSIRFWDVKTGQQKTKVNDQINAAMTVFFSHDGTTLASCSYDKSIRLWDIKTGQQKAKLDGHTNCINAVSFSPDGTTLASGSDDKSIRLWDIKTGQQKAQFDGHSKCINAVSFSPDGTILACSRYDNSISLWNIITGEQILPSDHIYKEILSQFKPPIIQKNIYPESSNLFFQLSLAKSNITVLLISQQLIFQSQGALILKGEIINQSGIDLRTLFLQRGSFILENQIGLQQN